MNKVTNNTFSITILLSFFFFYNFYATVYKCNLFRWKNVSFEIYEMSHPRGRIIELARGRGVGTFFFKYFNASLL